MDYKPRIRTFRPRGKYNIYQRPFPDIYRCRVTWISNGYQILTVGPITAGAGPRNAYLLYAANNIFDPDIKWGQAQYAAQGHEQLAKLYEYYMVEKATIRVRYASISSTVTSNQETMYVGSLNDGDIKPTEVTQKHQLKAIWPYMKCKDFVHENLNVIWLYTTWKPSMEWPARNPYEDPRNWWNFGVKPSKTQTQYAPYLIAGACYNDAVTEASVITPNVAESTFRIDVAIYYDIICVRKAATWSIGWEPAVTTEDPLDYTGQGEDPDEDGTPLPDGTGGNPTGSLPVPTIGAPDP